MVSSTRRDLRPDPVIVFDGIDVGGGDRTGSFSRGPGREAPLNSYGMVIDFDRATTVLGRRTMLLF